MQDKGIFKIGVRSGVKDAKLHDKGGNIKGITKRKGRKKGLDSRRD